MLKSLKQVWAFLIIVLIGACRGEPTTTPRLEHPVGKALEGIYSVCYGSPDRTYDIGTLKLKDGLYSFTPLIPVEQIPKAATNRLSFMNNPEGQYSLKYQDSINENTLLEELNGFTFLVLIRFSVPAATAGGTSDLDGVFFVASDQESKSLVFHSFFSELQLWCVGKSWD